MIPLESCIGVYAFENVDHRSRSSHCSHGVQHVDWLLLGSSQPCVPALTVYRLTANGAFEAMSVMYSYLLLLGYVVTFDEESKVRLGADKSSAYSLSCFNRYEWG